MSAPSPDFQDLFCVSQILLNELHPPPARASELRFAEPPLLLDPRGIPTVPGLPQHFNDAQGTQAKMAEWEKHLEISVKRLFPERRCASAKLAKCQEQDGNEPIAGRVRTNAFGCFRQNDMCQINLPTFSGRLRAVRDVAAGEEITVTYMDKLLLPSAQRQEILAPYGFTCACETCIDGEASDLRRAALRMSSSGVLPASPGGLLKSYLGQMKLVKNEGLQTGMLYYDLLSRPAELQ
ncbi:hypothetical protein FB107DRAFT_274776 [Schizophyllum commune]